MGALAPRDSGRAWTVTGRGGNMLPEALAQYFDDEEAMLIRRSAGNNQARNPAESSTGRLNNNTFANQLRGHLGPPTWTDMMRGACKQINDAPCAYPPSNVGGRGGAESLMSRSEALLGKRPDYSARWPGYPGQAVWILNEDGRPLAGRERCRAGYFVGPCDGVGGWNARELSGNQHLVATTNLGFIDDTRLIHGALALSDNLLLLAGPLRGQVAAVREATRSLFRDPAQSASPQLVVLEPLADAPVQLVPALDESGDPILVRRESWPLGPEELVPIPRGRKKQGAAKGAADPSAQASPGLGTLPPREKKDTRAGYGRFRSRRR